MSGLSDEDLTVRRRGRLLAIAVLMGLLVALSWQAGHRSAAGDTPATPPSQVDMASLSPATHPGAIGEPVVWRSIDRASVEWDKTQVETDPAPFCFAAYGDV